MDKNKFQQQAQVLRQKKLTRMSQAKQSRPTVENGVVKYNAPVPLKPTDIRTFSAVPPANKVTRSILSPQQNISPQTVQPKKVTRRSNGCAGCRRNIGK